MSALHWRGADAQVQAARTLPGWREFHRLCGDHGLYFTDICRDQKGGPYRATTHRIENRRGFSVSVPVSEGKGATPVDATLAALRAAVASSFAFPSAAAQRAAALLTEKPPAAAGLMELIG